MGTIWDGTNEYWKDHLTRIECNIQTPHAGHAWNYEDDDGKGCPAWCEGIVLTDGISVTRPSTIASIVSPDAPMTTNEKGGSQSQIDARFDLIDAKAMFEMAKVLDHGAKKYGANNWRNIDLDDHLNHLLMHTFAYLAGDRTDDHLSHILCRATFALGVSLQNEDVAKDPYADVAYSVLDQEPEKFYTQDQVDEIDRNARAFGWEIGRGAIMVGNMVGTSDSNPFMSPHWKSEMGFVERCREGVGNPIITCSLPKGHAEDHLFKEIDGNY